MNCFKKYFSKEDFEYIKYDPVNNHVIINLESTKTQKKLNEIVMQLIDELKRFLKIS